MFERFTDRARRVVVLAQDEARDLNHNYIGTEHILLGMLREGEGVAAAALHELGISLESARQRVEEIIGRGKQEPAAGHIPFTPRAKKVLELALRESLQLGHDYIGTEHILLGLVREGEGVGVQALTQLGAGEIRVRRQVIQLLHEMRGEEGERVHRSSVRVVGSPAQLDEIVERLGIIAGRLAAIERRLGLGQDVPGAPEPPTADPGPGEAPSPGAG